MHISCLVSFGELGVFHPSNHAACVQMLLNVFMLLVSPFISSYQCISDSMAQRPRKGIPDSIIASCTTSYSLQLLCLVIAQSVYEVTALNHFYYHLLLLLLLLLTLSYY